jgi:flagellar assembly protein FliH
MTSSPKRIIRGASIEGVMFCTPTGPDTEDPQARKEKDNLKALEEFWYNKGAAEAKQKGFDEGYSAGQKEGHRKGFQEGEQKGKEEGLAEGHERGIEEGRNSIKEELVDAVKQVQELSERIKEKQQSLCEEAKSELVEFSMAVCEKLIRQRLGEADSLKKVLERVVQQAIPIIKQCPVEIFLSEHDLKVLGDAGLKESIIEGVAGGEATTVRFLSDESMRSGDCRLETSLGLVNFDIRRILGELEKRVLEVRADEQIPAEAPTQTLPPAVEAAAEAQAQSEVASETTTSQS